MSKMLAAVLHDFNKLELEDVERPAPRAPGTVLVRIKSCGICQTDYKAIKGIRRNVKFPLIPGHEPSGVVAEAGPGVLHFRPGDEVICQPSRSANVSRISSCLIRRGPQTPGCLSLKHSR